MHMPKRKRRDQDGVYERPDSPFWWASYIDGSGRATRRSTGIPREGENSRTRAAVLRSQWILEAASEGDLNHLRPPREHTFDELMLLYLAGPSREKRSGERDQFSAKQLFPFFTDRVLEKLKGSDVRSYIEWRRAGNVSNGTINREIGLLSAALNWARRELEWEISNPVEGRKLKVPVGRSRWLNRMEADKLIAAAKGCRAAPHLVDFIRLGLHTGMRTGEMLGLTWSRVDFAALLVYFDASDQKNGQVGSVPINQEAREALAARARFRDAHCPESPWVFCDGKGKRIASIKKSFATAVSRAELEDVHPHDLRRTCGSWLVQSGVSIQAVSSLLRHSDIRITDKIYAHLSPEAIRSAVEKLNVRPVSRSVSR